MKRWTIVMACALAIGLMSAPVGVYADHHGAEESSDSGNGGGDGACGGDGGGDSESSEGSH